MENYKNSSSYKELALTQLKGNWGIAVIVTFIAWLLTDAFTTGNGSNQAAQYIWQNGSLIRIDNGEGMKGALSFVSFVLGGPVSFGVAAFFLKLVRSEGAQFNEFFSGFKYFLKTFLLNILIYIFTILWFFLLIIPGFIAMLKYSMAFYILHDNPELSPLEAITRSKIMMDGHKARLFYLWLSFLGWFLLGIMTLGIGMLFAIPYYRAAQANFYEELKINEEYA